MLIKLEHKLNPIKALRLLVKLLRKISLGVLELLKRAEALQ